jgi:carboxypeptidase family protein
MRGMLGAAARWVLPVLFVIGAPYAAAAQTGTTGTIVGTVTDESGAVIPGATVDVLDLATNAARSTVTGSRGDYVVPTLPPGEYRITVSLSGFRTTMMTVKVEVARSVLGNVALKLGTVQESVLVTGSVETELQTIDASVGAVLGAEKIVRLPTVQRRATELAYLQPGAQPRLGGGSGGIAGARGDQNVFTLDGIDISEPAAGGIYNQFGAGMMVPVDAIEEFRATSTNANATFGRSSGGQFNMTMRRGSNQFKGAVYEYHQNDAFDANSWTRNRLHQPFPTLRDNRYGGRLGGPLRRGKTFFFGFYEGRRFPQSTDLLRLVPSESLRQGILRFRDGQGNIVNYDLRTSTLCGPANASACDPRGVGISPVMLDLMQHYPHGNSPSDGDGLNTVGFRAPDDTSQTNDITLWRFDHNVNTGWRLNGSFLWQRERTGNTAKAEMDPTLTGGDRFLPLSGSPSDPRMFGVTLSGQLTKNMFNEVRGGRSRVDVSLDRALPRVQVAAAGVPMDFAGGLLDDPGDPNGIGPQLNQPTTWNFSDNLTWTKGLHTIAAGTNIQRIDYHHWRTERQGLVNTTPIAKITAGTFVSIPASQRPPTCQGAQANCLSSRDQATWNQLYGGLLGILDSEAGLVARDPSGRALPLGTPLENDAVAWHSEYFVADTWRATSSLTLNLGVNVMVETPVKDKLGRQALVVDMANGQPINPHDYLAAKEAAALRGETFNSLIGFAPISQFDRGVYPVQRSLAPRLAATWQPSLGGSVLRALFGDQKTVFRGGYSLMFDRQAIGRPVETPVGGNENLAQTVSIQAPLNGQGQPYRVGVDGPVPDLMTAAPQTIPLPYVPSVRNAAAGTQFGITRGDAYDPFFERGRTHSANFTVQRELPWSSIVELGWIGRYARGLPLGLNINAVPYMIKDMSGLSGQTFAQAYNSISGQLRSGTLPAAVTPQPWFENNLGAGGTAAVAAADTSDFVSGGVGNLFITQIDPRLVARGRSPVTSQQFQSMNYTSFGGWSDYNAFFISYHQRALRGLTFDLNYTLSRLQDTGGRNQDSGGGFVTNPFDVAYDYGDAVTDRRHVLAAYGNYQLPFGGQHPLAGGWSISFVFTAFTGLPLSIGQGGNLFGTGGQESVPMVGDATYAASKNFDVPGSGGVGTSGNPSTGGTGVNMFANPEAVFRNFRPLLLGEDTRTSRGKVRGFGFKDLDLSIGKSFRMPGDTRLSVSADFFNVANTVLFANPSLSLLSPASFGVVTRQAGNQLTQDFSGSRSAQLGVRFEF